MKNYTYDDLIKLLIDENLRINITPRLKFPFDADFIGFKKYDDGAVRVIQVYNTDGDDGISKTVYLTSKKDYLSQENQENISECLGGNSWWDEYDSVEEALDCVGEVTFVEEKKYIIESISKILPIMRNGVAVLFFKADELMINLLNQNLKKQNSTIKFVYKNEYIILTDKKKYILALDSQKALNILCDYLENNNPILPAIFK